MIQLDECIVDYLIFIRINFARHRFDSSDSVFPKR